MKHTPGPWGHVGALIRAPDGNRTIATVWGEGLAGSQQEADVWRIVACVNACEGINPEAVPELLESLSPFAARHDRLIQEGDRPLKVLVPFSWLEEARAVLAKAKEES